MSSTKRSYPELIQCKAPDKWETSSSSKTATSNATNCIDNTVDTMSSSTAAKSQQQQQSRDASKAGNSTQQVNTKVRKNIIHRNKRPHIKRLIMKMHQFTKMHIFYQR